MILVNNPGSWNYLYPPLDHASWHGCTPTDLVFPFFLFAVGNAMAFTMPTLQKLGAAAMWKKVAGRTVLIFCMGLFLNAFPFVKYNADGILEAKRIEHLRIMGVLQRIALCYFFAAIMVYYLRATKAFVAGIMLLMLYWAACLAFGNAAEPFSLNGWFGTEIDKMLLGESHMYHGEGIAFDPEGLASTLPAIVQVIFGYLVGDYIIQKKAVAPMQLNAETGEIKPDLYPLVANLFVVAVLLVFSGLCWSGIFPMNKKIWTGSYVVYTSGLAIIVLAMLIYVIDIHNKKGKWTGFFDVFGKNALFIFLLSGVWARVYGLFRIPDGMNDGTTVYKGLGTWMYDHLFAVWLGNMNGSLGYAVFHVLIFWFLAWRLHKRKIYFKV